MKIALIISTYNRPETLSLTLQSVMLQRILPHEVIIADDGSTSDTKEIINKFQKTFPIPLKHVWQVDDGFRLAAIRNKAIIASTSDYLIFTDGDIILHRNFIQSHKVFAKQNQFCQGHRVLLDEKLTKESIAKKQLKFRFFDSGIINRFNAIHHLGFSKLFSKKVNHNRKVKGCNFSCWKTDALKVNGFNEAFIGWGKEDAEFIARLLNVGVIGRDIKFAAVVFHLDHSENFKNETSNALNGNVALTDKASSEKLVWCEDGILKGERSE